MTAQRVTEAPQQAVSRVAEWQDLEDLARRLHPGANRAEALGRLDDLFRSGTAPDPLPEGFHPGRLLGTSIWGPFDRAVQRLAAVWMPWQGKSFTAEASAGVNRFTSSARLALKAFFPKYTPEHVDHARIDAFPFRTRVAPGELDPSVQVLKIDYDFEANPDFIIRRILDELVQVAPGVYLGKVLFRVRERFYPIGFFSLRSVSA